MNLISSNLTQQKLHNRDMLEKVISSVGYLARQSLGLNRDRNYQRDAEENLALHQLLLLRGEDDETLL